MVEYYGRDVQPEPRSVLTVGTFDGVHRGHMTVLSRVVERASAVDGVPSVLTFDPHPREVIAGEIVPLITTLHERIELLSEVGIERVVVVPFDDDFASLSPEAYVRDVLYREVGIQEIVVGYDHTFGKGRKGGQALLEALASELGFRMTILPPIRNDESVISSSAIRHVLLIDGDVSRAERSLGRFYSISGKVVPGDGRGTSIGFPTANMSAGHSRKIIPLRGVYAVRVRVGEASAALPGMMNIGFRPTFDGAGLRVEVNIFDFDEDLYGRVLQVEFVKRIRDERKFDSIEALRQQLNEDRARCTDVLAGVS